MSARPGSQLIAGVAAGLVALGVVGYAGWSVVRSSYLVPRAQLADDLESARTSVARQRRALAAASDVYGPLSELAARSLGDRADTVDHRVRVQLNRILEASGMTEPSVRTGRPRVLGTPMRTAFPRRGGWSVLRNEADFATLEASLTAEGTLAEALDALARLRAAPWPKRIEVVRLDPDAAGERITLRVTLLTVYLPDSVAEAMRVANGDRPMASGDDPDPRAVLAAVVPDPESATVAEAATILRRRPFMMPAPAPPVVAVSEPPPADPPSDPGPPPFPWKAWRVTGVADGPAGPEVWLRHDGNARSRVLQPGESLNIATLVAVGEDVAEFKIDERHVRVTVGSSLAPVGARAE